MKTNTKQPIEQAESGNIVKPVLANRLLKFRAFHKSRKKMYQVFSFCSDFITITHDKIEKLPINEFEQIMQFIGYFDENGKELYYGDVVSRQTSRDSSRLLLIDWNENYQETDFYTLDRKMTFGKRHDHDTLVGNIYENPILLQTGLDWETHYPQLFS